MSKLILVIDVAEHVDQEDLAKIKPTLTYSPNAKFGAIPILNALRAVVEFHKPNEFGDCSICVIRTVIDLEVASYPCPIIQAIEKELK